MNGIEIRISGQLKAKKAGVSQKSGKAYRFAEVVYVGGKEMLHLDQEQFDALPNEGEPVVVLADGEREGRDGMRLNNCRVQVAKPARAAA